jgi:hypothetical protein
MTTNPDLISVTTGKHSFVYTIVSRSSGMARNYQIRADNLAEAVAKIKRLHSALATAYHDGGNKWYGSHSNLRVVQTG